MHEACRVGAPLLGIFGEGGVVGHEGGAPAVGVVRVEHNLLRARSAEFLRRRGESLTTDLQSMLVFGLAGAGGVGLLR